MLDQQEIASVSNRVDNILSLQASHEVPRACKPTQRFLENQANLELHSPPKRKKRPNHTIKNIAFTESFDSQKRVIVGHESSTILISVKLSKRCLRIIVTLCEHAGRVIRQPLWIGFQSEREGFLMHEIFRIAFELLIRVFEVHRDFYDGHCNSSLCLIE